MRTFELIRQNDETGISGTGKVLEGVIFSDSTCVTRWVSDRSAGRSTAVWDNMGSFLAIHVHPHPSNDTVIKFSDGSTMMYNEEGQLVERGPAQIKPSKRKAKAA